MNGLMIGILLRYLSEFSVRNPRKTRKIGMQMGSYPGNKGALSEVSFAKDTKESNPAKTMDLKDVECFKCHKKGHYANKCPDAKSKDEKGFFKVRQLEEPASDKKDEKAIRI